MTAKGGAGGPETFLLANQVQRIIREGESEPARRVSMLEKLLQMEREALAAAPPPEPAPMAVTPGGIRLHGR
jgi:hypothetical protein